MNCENKIYLIEKNQLNKNIYAQLINKILNWEELQDESFQFNWGGDYSYTFCLQGKLCELKNEFISQGFVECDEKGNIL